MNKDLFQAAKLFRDIYLSRCVTINKFTELGELPAPLRDPVTCLLN